MGHLAEFSGKTLQSAAKGTLDDASLKDETSQKKRETQEESHKALLSKIQEVLGDKVKEVRVTERLTESPACLVASENDMTGHMQRILQEAGHAFGGVAKPILEINPEHALLVKMSKQEGSDHFSDLAHLLYEQALLSEGGTLNEPGLFVRRLNRLLSEVMV